MLHELMEKGGATVTWPIAVLSVVATCVILERLYFWAGLALRRRPSLRRDARSAAPSPDLEARLSADPVAEALYWLRVRPSRGRVMASRLAAETHEGTDLLEKCGLLSIALGIFGSVVGLGMSGLDSAASDPSRLLTATLLGLGVALWCFLAQATFSLCGSRLQRALGGGS